MVMGDGQQMFRFDEIFGETTDDEGPITGRGQKGGADPSAKFLPTD